MWDDIPNRVRHGRLLRRLLESVGQFCQWYTYRPTAPNDPGVAGSAIHVVSARAYVSVSWARATADVTTRAATPAATRRREASAGQRAIDGFGKAIILSWKHGELGVRATGEAATAATIGKSQSAARDGVDDAWVEDVLDAEHARGK